jgi:hypothetical protein
LHGVLVIQRWPTGSLLGEQQPNPLRFLIVVGGKPTTPGRPARKADHTVVWKIRPQAD